MQRAHPGHASRQGLACWGRRCQTAALGLLGSVDKKTGEVTFDPQYKASNKESAWSSMLLAAAARWIWSLRTSSSGRRTAREAPHEPAFDVESQWQNLQVLRWSTMPGSGLSGSSSSPASNAPPNLAGNDNHRPLQHSLRRTWITSRSKSRMNLPWWFPLPDGFVEKARVLCLGRCAVRRKLGWSLPGCQVDDRQGRPGLRQLPPAFGQDFAWC